MRISYQSFIWTYGYTADECSPITQYNCSKNQMSAKYWIKKKKTIQNSIENVWNGINNIAWLQQCNGRLLSQGKYHFRNKYIAKCISTSLFVRPNLCMQYAFANDFAKISTMYENKFSLMAMFRPMRQISVVKSQSLNDFVNEKNLIWATI